MVNLLILVTASYIWYYDHL